MRRSSSSKYCGLGTVALHHAGAVVRIAQDRNAHVIVLFGGDGREQPGELVGSHEAQTVGEGAHPQVGLLVIGPPVMNVGGMDVAGRTPSRPR